MTRLTPLSPGCSRGSARDLTGGFHTRAMTCYFRHMRDLFKEAGIGVDGENRKELDRVIHEMMGTEYKDCSSTWREVKERLASDRMAFIDELRGRWGRV